MAESDKYDLFIDGASKGNPGAAGAGAIIKERKSGTVISKIYKYLGNATNNCAEYSALIYGLQEALVLGLRNLNLYSDSELLIKQLNGEYKIKAEGIKQLYQQYKHLVKGFESFEAVHIKRALNKDADKLANEAVKLGKFDI